MNCRLGVVALPGATGEDERLVHNGGAGASEGQFGKDCAIGGVGGVSCTYEGVVEPGDTLILSFPVEVVRGKLPLAPFPSPAWPAGCEGAPAGAVGRVTNVVRVSGGGAPAPAEVRTPTVIGPKRRQGSGSPRVARPGRSRACRRARTPI